MDEVKYHEGKQKKSHPIERANPISKIFFCWLLPYFVKGLKKELDEDDMYATRKSDQSARLGDKLEAAWNVQLLKNKNPSLFMALFKVFQWEYIFYIFWHAVMESLKLAQPLLISKLLSFYDPSRTDLKKEDSYLYAGLLILNVMMIVTGNHNYQLRVMAMGMDVRVATCSLIYRKALRLSKSALAETTIGQMVNLLSNDVSRFDFVAQHINYLWIAPLETVVIMYLLYLYVGFSGLAGAVFLLSFIPFQMYMGKMTSIYRLKTALRTDERVRLMNEIISGIQVIKMYTWEKPFSKLVELSRRKEIEQIRATSLIRAIMMSCNLVLNRVAIYLCIITYMLTDNTVNASYVYTITSFYGMLRQAVTMFFPQAITQFAETTVSVNRIKTFLLYNETDLALKESVHEISKISMNGANGIMKSQTDVGINLYNVSVKWLTNSPDYTLGNVDFHVSSTQLVAVVGPVGGGKTTLLHAILRELPPQKGIADIEGTISYASQEPWLFGGSVRQNIIFGQEFDQKKYDEVVRVCALQRDFKLFAQGDRTLVGERGVTLSGGQRARINLARAVYKEADIYLLDDPLSAVDTHVGKQLFEQCMAGYLKNKCVILVTHQLQYLRNVDRIYLLENGMVTISGTYEEMQASDTQFTKLLAESEEEEIKENNENNQLSASTNKRESKVEEFIPVKQDREDRATGTISKRVYMSFFRAGGNLCKSWILMSSFIVSQIFGSSTDYFLTLWVNYEQWKTENNNTRLEDTRSDIWFGEENRTTLPLNVTANANTDLLLRIQDFLFGEWTVYVYSTLVLTTVLITVSRSIGFFRFCLTVSRRMHNNMFNKIVFSPMRFFNTNPSGRILNRFSKDIGALDETLPTTLVDTIQIGLTVCAITIVVGTLNPWIFLPTVIMLTIFYFMRRIFLASSRNIKRVEAVTRSPVYTHLTATLQGLTTIRAFRAQKVLTKEFDNYQDISTGAYYMFLTANRSFGFWLDFHCVIYIAFIIASLIFMKSETFGGNIGLALTQSMTLTGMFQWGMRQWSELENQMTSVERVQEYADLMPEADDRAEEIRKSWPENGALEFRNMFMRYSAVDNFVLKNLNLIIQPKEKIGIVGRTGAGKSSIIQALFRLAEISGDIFIDGLDTKTVPLSRLRSSLSIIPQEPVLFSGTLRKNLDPFDEFNDESLWSALEDVELKSAVEELPSGLNNKMAEGGSNFSVGQRQLLCLARSIVRNNKILVLDEATANVDPHTDALIQQTIRRKFAQCTVLTVAHRLHTIMDSDKVIVMDAGRVAEFDHPYLLLKNNQGIFFKLVQQTGSAMAGSLFAVAENSYNRNQ